MQLEKLAKTFWQQGYIVIEDLFSAETMGNLQSLIVGHYGLNPKYEHEETFLSKSATEVIPWFPQKSGLQAFDEIEHCTKIQALTGAILGAGWQGLYCMTMFSKKAPKGKLGTKIVHPMILNNSTLTALFTPWTLMTRWAEKC
jgi:ectoine hydroxylase